MTSKQIEKIVHHEPFIPFRVLLDNGEEIIVERPRKASVSGDQVALVGLTRWPNGNGKVGLRFVLVEAHDYGWTTNLPVEYFLAEDSLFAWSNDGQPIPPEHGGPVRLIVPRLYAWKSAKWIRGVRFLEHDEAGYWEEGGYHMRGDPWAGGDGERFRWS